MKNKKIITYYIFLSILNLAVYLPSLFHTPRSDQLLYFANVSGIRPSLFDLTFKSLALNRVDLPYPMPDALLFRPLTYLFLGVETWVFQYNFILWQLTGLILHLTVIWFLLKLLMQINESRFALFFCVLFSTMFAGVEMVIWQHINSYLLFLILILIVFNEFQKLTDREKPNRKSVVTIITCLGVSCLLFELGVIISFLFGLYFILIKKQTRAGVYCFLLTAGYTALSILNFLILKPSFGQAANLSLSLGHIVLLIKNTFLSIGWWLFGGLFPTQLDILPFGRTFLAPRDVVVSGQFFTPSSLLSLPVMAGIGLTCLLIYLFLYAFRVGHVRNNRDKILIPLSIIIIFAGLVSLGRIENKGLISALGSNAYYHYIVWLFMTVFIYQSLPFEALLTQRKVSYLLNGSLIILVITNVYTSFSFNLTKATIDKPKREIAHAIKSLAKQNTAQKFQFSVKNDSKHVLTFNEMSAAAGNTSNDCNFAKLLFPDNYNEKKFDYLLALNDDGTWRVIDSSMKE